MTEMVTLSTFAPAVVVRNMTKGVLVIASDPKRTAEVTFGAKGSPDGDDYQHMPEEILRTPAFAKQLAIGTLAVVEGEDSPLVRAAVQNQANAFWKRAAQDADDALSVLDHEPDNDYLAVPCIGPGARAGATCGTEVPVKAASAGVQPPLCDLHIGLAERAVKRGSQPWVIE
jgi:hypothetical protein